MPSAPRRRGHGLQTPSDLMPIDWASYEAITQGLLPLGPLLDVTLLMKTWELGRISNTENFSVFMCPISRAVMVDPVMASDGYTYERCCIEQWLETSSRSPMTNLELPYTLLVPNHAVRMLLKSLMEHTEPAVEEHSSFTSRLSADVTSGVVSNAVALSNWNSASAQPQVWHSSCGIQNRNGIAKAHFNGEPYGTEYLSFNTGDVICHLEHQESTIDWAYGICLDGDRSSSSSERYRGWFPLEYVDFTDRHLHEAFLLPSAYVQTSFEMSRLRTHLLTNGVRKECSVPPVLEMIDVPAGARVIILSYREGTGWVQVRWLDDGRVGYMPARNLAKVTTDP